MEHFSQISSQLFFPLRSDEEASLRLSSRLRRRLLWTAPSSHVKQGFVPSNESPKVAITFAVCHADLLWCCRLWLYRDNGRLLCLISLWWRELSAPPFLTVFVPLPPSSCTLLRKRWWGHWHHSAHLIQLLQKHRQSSSSSLDHDVQQPEGGLVEEGGRRRQEGGTGSVL